MPTDGNGDGQQDPENYVINSGNAAPPQHGTIASSQPRPSRWWEHWQPHGLLRQHPPPLARHQPPLLTRWQNRGRTHPLARRQTVPSFLRQPPRLSRGQRVRFIFRQPPRLARFQIAAFSQSQLAPFSQLQILSLPAVRRDVRERTRRHQRYIRYRFIATEHNSGPNEDLNQQNSSCDQNRKYSSYECPIAPPQPAAVATTQENLLPLAQLIPVLPRQPLPSSDALQVKNIVSRREQWNWNWGTDEKENVNTSTDEDMRDSSHESEKSASEELLERDAHEDSFNPLDFLEQQPMIEGLHLSRKQQEDFNAPYDEKSVLCPEELQENALAELKKETLRQLCKKSESIEQLSFNEQCQLFESLRKARLVPAEQELPTNPEMLLAILKLHIFIARNEIFHEVPVHHELHINQQELREPRPEHRASTRKNAKKNTSGHKGDPPKRK